MITCQSSAPLFFPSVFLVSFLFVSIPFLSKMSFVPRRSPRIAAKAATKASEPVKAANAPKLVITEMRVVSDAPRLIIEEIKVIPDEPQALVNKMCAVADTASKSAHVALDDAKAAFAAYKEFLNAKSGPESAAALKKLETICSNYGLGGSFSKTSKPTKLTKDQSRTAFLANKGKPISEEFKQECIGIIKRYLNDCESARGRTAKAVYATRLANYLLQVPEFMAAHAGFHACVLKKMNELKEEGEIPDAVVDSDFRQAVNDLLFVVSA